MFRISIHPLELAGIGFTVALLILAWAGRDRLNAFGLEFLAWRRTSNRQNVEALAFGSFCGFAVALLFQALYKGAPFKWQDAWIGITLGPFMEEAVFRGYLFGLAELGLRKRVPHPRWIVGIAIAAVFALCHLPKAGITGLQIGVIFVMGVVYAWLRIKSNSTTSPFLAHSAYNAIIFSAAALIA
ncbi:MAG: CPBP family intramembrane glutamic endopeptidase [Bryobacteraceae bacterium]